MYRKYLIMESIASIVSQYESYCDQVYHYTPSQYSGLYCGQIHVLYQCCDMILIVSYKTGVGATNVILG